MFARVHPPTDVQGGNKGSCTDLARYLEKEGDDKFFNQTREDVSGDQVIHDIDHNIKALGKDETKFFMLSLNPSEKELHHVIGREVHSFNELTPEERAALSDHLKTFTRQAMTDYAQNFHRATVKDGNDLLYYARIEQDRHYTKADQEVREGRARIGEVKPGLNVHVHVIVSRKSADGKVKLSPATESTGNTWELKGRTVKRGFSHEDWKVKVQDTFNSLFSYQSIEAETYRPKGSSQEQNPAEEIAANEYKPPGNGKNPDIPNNADLRDILTNYRLTSANQVVYWMQQRGYSHNFAYGTHFFTRKAPDGRKETTTIKNAKIRPFIAKIPPEVMKDIASRFNYAQFKENPDGYNQNGISTQKVSFDVSKDGNKKTVSYYVLYDQKTKTSVNASRVRSYVLDNQQYQQNEKEQSQRNEGSGSGHKAGAAQKAAESVGRRITGKIENEILGESFQIERKGMRTVRTANQLVTNPKGGIKSMLIRAIVKFLGGPFKEI